MSIKKTNYGSGEEIEFASDIDLISTTEPSSRVTYANEPFCEVANYLESELLGKPHNVVRHPDMPQSAFKQMWKTIQLKESWMGLVKNTRKGGGYYWVSAFITPITDAAGNIVEYQSVRSKPNREWVKRAEHLYAQMRQGNTPTRLKLPRFSFCWIRDLAAGITIASSAAVVAGASPVLCGAVSLFAMSVLLVNSFCHRLRLKLVQKAASEVYENPLMELIYTSKHDDYSVIELALQKRKAEIRAIVGRTTETTADIHANAQNELSSLEKVKDNLVQQGMETQSVAAAITEMTHSIREVADNTTEASKLVEQVNQLADQGSTIVETTINSVDDLHKELEEAKRVINNLSVSSQEIEKILEVIGGIADQTNLLALNAAIEAARAGETGRGFAVVADEVRTLASKTQASTEEIQSMISHLQNTASQAVKAMNQGGNLSDVCRQNAIGTGEVLGRINSMLGDVTSASYQIATAVGQQANVTEEINTNVASIQQLSDSNNDLGDESVVKTTQLVSKLAELQRLIVQFKQK